MKKILLLTIDFPPQIGGVANYLANIGQNLPSDKIVVLANCDNNSGQFDRKQSYKIYRQKLITTAPIWPKWIPAIYHTWQIIKKEKPDLVLTAHMLPLGTVAYIFKKIWGLDYFISLHGLDILTVQKNKRKKSLAQLILKNARQIIVNSQFTKKEATAIGVDEKKITILYPCPNIRATTSARLENVIARSSSERRSNLAHHDNERLPRPAKAGLAMTKGTKKILLTVGRLVERKGHDQVIKAFPQVLEKFPDATYLIASSGDYEEELKNLVAKLNLKNKVVFAGRVSDEELPDYYKSADIFIMTARQIDQDVEGFGMVYLEAAGFALPVIAGRSGGVAEAVLDKQTGLLVDPKNSQEIAQAIIKLLTDEDLANKLGRAGKARVEQIFNWPTQIEKLKNLLSSD